MTTGTATCPLDLRLPPTLFAVTGTAPAVRARVEGELSVLAAELGVPVRPVVTIGTASSARGDSMICVYGSGTLCAVADSVVAEALAYVDGSPSVVPVAGPQMLLDRLGGAGALDLDRLGELLGLVCRHAVSRRPDVLLPQSPLRPVLELGISVAGHDIGALSDELRDGTAEGSEAVERLVSALSAPRIELLIDPAYLRSLTEGNQGAGLFPFLRDGLFAELGLALPPFHLRLDPSLRPGGFAIRMQSVRTVPRIGLATGTIMVNDTTERLRLMDVDGEATTNPATDQPATIVSAQYREMLESAGLTVWDPFGYLILAFAEAIRRRAYTLMNTAVASDALLSHGRDFPILAGAAGSLRLGELTFALRELLADQVSILNLRLILELLLRYETDPEARLYGDRAAFVRSGLAEQIAAKAARNTMTIVVYLLDPAIETAVRGLARATSGDSSRPLLVERVHAAVAAELAYLPPTAQVPLVLTQDDVRRTLRTVLQPRFPRVGVLGYGDLPGHYNIQPVARVSWS